MNENTTLPRTITSVEELENLPPRSVFLDREETAWQRLPESSYFHAPAIDDYQYLKDLFDCYSPLTLIYQPEDNE